MRIAVTGSPGIPSVIIGISAPPVTALFADSGAAMPSTAPQRDAEPRVGLRRETGQRTDQHRRGQRKQRDRDDPREETRSRRVRHGAVRQARGQPAVGDPEPDQDDRREQLTSGVHASVGPHPGNHSNSERGTPDWRMIDISVPVRNSP